jgi:hypothetical protein
MINERMHMFKYLFRLLKEEIDWVPYKRALNSMTEAEQFRNYILKVQPQEFLIYQKSSTQKRLEFNSVINELGIHLKGIRFLDIGPGYGDSLDICHENKADCIDFVESNPFFFHYNRLKGYAKGYPFNHLIWLSRLYPKKYDFIWVKGSVNADHFIINDKLKIKSLLFSSWITHLDKLASSTCQIIICPTWLHDSKKRDIEDLQCNLFTKTMLNSGYVILPKIKNHNVEPIYPITFYKKLSLDSNKSK